MKRAGADAVPTTTMQRDALKLDPDRHLCEVGNTPATLTAREMEPVIQLMKRPNHVMARPQLVDAIYGTNIHVSDRTMDNHLRNVRAKFAAVDCDDAIETVHGVGIRMGPCSAI